MFPHLSVERNITYINEGTPDMCNTSVTTFRFRENTAKLRRVAYPGGEQQRVALGRALYSKTDYFAPQ